MTFLSVRRMALMIALVLAALPTSPGMARDEKQAAASKAPIDYVDPFLGTDGFGNTFPGPTLPFGFIQPGPDTADTQWAASGYRFGKSIDGFSQQHISGMGGPLYGHISIFPTNGRLSNPAAIVSSGKSDESATPGYYTVRLRP